MPQKLGILAVGLARMGWATAVCVEFDMDYGRGIDQLASKLAEDRHRHRRRRGRHERGLRSGRGRLARATGRAARLSRRAGQLLSASRRQRSHRQLPARALRLLHQSDRLLSPHRRRGPHPLDQRDDDDRAGRPALALGRSIGPFGLPAPLHGAPSFLNCAGLHARRQARAGPRDAGDDEAGGAHRLDANRWARGSGGTSRPKARSIASGGW